MRATLGQIRTDLYTANYQWTALSSSEFDSRVNMVSQRFLSMGKFHGTIQRVRFNVSAGDFTLPRQYSACLGLVDRFGLPRLIADKWYQFHANGPGEETTVGRPHDLGDGYVVFKDIRDVNSAGCQLKVVTESAETNKDITFEGVDDDDLPVTETVEDITNVAQTTTASFKSLDRVVKDSTSSRVLVYAIDPDDASETLIARYEPSETLPCWRRYKLTNHDTSNDPDAVLAMVKRRFIKATADDDEIYPANIGALHLGLLALHYEINNETKRATEYWAMALLALNSELKESNHGLTASMQVAPGIGGGEIAYIR